MKEIKVLIQQLRNYPNNFFVYPFKGTKTVISGLIVCDKDGVKVGFIPTGVNDGKVIID